jgi:hypothetical protein
MLAADEVIGKARNYLEQVIPDFAALDPKVEEMVLAPDSSEWKITFYAHTDDNPKVATLADLIRRRRIEKVVSVAAEDGALIAVRNPPPF